MRTAPLVTGGAVQGVDAARGVLSSEWGCLGGVVMSGGIVHNRR